MAFTDLSNLPTASEKDREERDTTGRPPLADSLLVHRLAEHWRDLETASGPRSRAVPGTTFRFSDAGKCSRRLSLQAAGFPRAGMDLPGFWVTGIGTVIHDKLQELVIEQMGDRCEVEVICQWEDADNSGHVDFLLTFDCTDCDGEGGTHAPGAIDLAELAGTECETCDGTGRYIVLLELKTCGGYSYKLKIGERSAPQGPSDDNLRQAALQAAAIEKDRDVRIAEVRLGYLALESVSKPAAAKKRIDERTRFGAEWLLPREEWEQLVAIETKRLAGIKGLLEDGELASCKVPDSEIPNGAFIVDPARKGRWEVQGTVEVEQVEELTDEDGKPTGETNVTTVPKEVVVESGNYWGCDYCPMRESCIAIGQPGRVDVDDAWPAVFAALEDLEVPPAADHLSPVELALYERRDVLLEQLQADKPEADKAAKSDEEAA